MGLTKNGQRESPKLEDEIEFRTGRSLEQAKPRALVIVSKTL